MSQKVKGIFFDLDGTLVDTIEILRSVYFEFLENYGLQGNEAEFQSLNGPSLLEIINYLIKKYSIKCTPKNLLKEYLNILENRYVLKFNFSKENIICLDKIRQKGIKIYLVTSSSKSLIKPLLDIKGLTRLFDGFLFGDEVIKSKPDPEIYDKAIKKSKLKRNQIIVVEDSLNGIKSAKAAKLFVCAITSNCQPTHIDTIETDYIINNIEDVIFLIDNYGTN